MAAGKNPYLRYRILHSCFSNKQQRYWSLEALIGKLSKHDLVVDKRSVERDLEAMRYDERLGYKAPIAYDRKEKGYYYTEPTFNIDQLPLTEDDLQALTLAANILNQYKHVKFVQQFEGMMDKLHKMVNHLKKPQNEKLIAFEDAPYYKGHDFFDIVLNAITHQQPLRIRYCKFDNPQADDHVLHPYFLKENRGRWYVLGYSEERHYTITLGLDRFVSATNADIPFKENKKLKPKEYFHHTLGITVGRGPVEDIELWFSPALAPYIKTQHLHHSQKTVSDDESGLVISLRLIPNPELTQLLLSYGSDVKVLKSERLKMEIESVWKKCVNR